MTSHVVFVHFNDEVRSVESLMKRKHIRHVPVLKEGKLKGIVSLTDLQRLSFTSTLASVELEEELPAFDLLTLDQIMVRNPVTIPSETTIRQAAEILSNHEFHALPIVDSEVLVGMLTTTDLIKFMLTLH